MDLQKIHCPRCNGTGKLYDNTYGSVACLNCEGIGIVRLTREQQYIIDEIKEQKRIIELEQERKKAEIFRQEKEKERQQTIMLEQEKEKERQRTIYKIVFIVLLVGIAFLLIFMNWDAIWDWIVNLFNQLLVIAIFILALLIFISFMFNYKG